MKQDYEILKEYEVFSNYFQLLAGSVPKGPQRSWILRFLRGESFSVTAPPGLGKTTFGLAASIYSSVRGDRSILVFPTKSLVYQAKSKIEGIIDRLNVQLKYFSTVDGPQEEEYQILLTTSRYAMMHNELWSKGFRLIFVDDVDSVTKSRKSLDMLLAIITIT
jgi:reverse gyrase